MNPILNCLRASPTTADLFWDRCEYAALEEQTPDWFALESKESLQVVGKDACGGRFCLVPASSDYSGRLLYINSEGQAGVIADCLSEGIRMMIALPNWRDCLRFSGGGKIEEMKKAQVCSEADLRKRCTEIEARRRKLYLAFGLPEMPAPLETLHRVVSEGANLKVIATKDGCPFESLFNTFVVEGFPTSRQQAKPHRSAGERSC